MLRGCEGKVPGLNAVPWNPSMSLLSWCMSNDDSNEKRLIGELWARKSTGKGLYLMAQKKDEQGRGVREQLLAVIGMS